MNLPRFSSAKKTALVLPGILLLITLFSGFFLVRFLEGVGDGYLREQSEDIMEAMATGIQNELQSARSVVGALAGSPWILPVLVNPSADNIEKANSVLDRYNTNLNFSVCYLLDLQGDTVTSSNRNAPDSFVGKNYSFRPYFQEALRGDHSVYMAAGVTSQERGFYVASPVLDKQKKVMGVVAIKKNIEAMRRVLTGYTNAFFLNPDGVIFIAGSKDTVLKPLWPLSSAQISAIRDTKQFNITSFAPILSHPIENGDTVRFRKELCQVFKKPLGPPGWSLVLLAPLKSVFYFVLFGWIMIAFMIGIILILTIWTFSGIKGQELLRESEGKYRGLFENSRDAVMVLSPSSGKFISGNPATMEMFRVKDEKTFTSLGPWDLSSEHQPDGSVSSQQAKKMIEAAVLGGFHFFEWTHRRLDGKEFPATVLLTRIGKGQGMILLATVRDITRQKQDEAALKQKVEELERFNKIAVGRELKMIELKAKIKALEERKARS